MEQPFLQGIALAFALQLQLYNPFLIIFKGLSSQFQFIVVCFLYALHLGFHKLTLTSHSLAFLLAYVAFGSSLITLLLSLFQIFLCYVELCLACSLNLLYFFLQLLVFLCLFQLSNLFVYIAYLRLMRLEIPVGLQVVEDSRNERTLNVERNLSAVCSEVSYLSVVFSHEHAIHFSFRWFCWQLFLQIVNSSQRQFIGVIVEWVVHALGHIVVSV